MCCAWIIDNFLYLLLPLSVWASNETAGEVTCNNIRAFRISKYMTYLGCYNLTCFVPSTNSTITDIDQCTSDCKIEGHSYAALFNQSLCFCGAFTCDSSEKECDDKCGLACTGNTGVVLNTCGGKSYIQAYKDSTSNNYQNNNQPEIEWTIPAAMVGVVLTIAVCLTCYVAGMYGRRCKRRQDRHQAERPAIPTEVTSRRLRPRSTENVYSTAGVITACCLLRLVRKRAPTTSPRLSQISNQADGNYTEIGTGGTRNEATIDLSDGHSIPDHNIKPERSKSDRDHEYEDPTDPPRSASSDSQIGGDGYLVPGTLPRNTNPRVYYSTTIKQMESRKTKVDVEDQIEYIDFE